MKKSSLVTGFALASTLLSAPVLQAGQNPFAHTELQSGFNYNQEKGADQGHAEGKCGEGKCGEGMGDATAGDHKADIGDDAKKCPEGKCGEGKCGEGVCGGDKCAEGKCGGETGKK